MLQVTVTSIESFTHIEHLKLCAIDFVISDINLHSTASVVELLGYTAVKPNGQCVDANAHNAINGALICTFLIYP